MTQATDLTTIRAAIDAKFSTPRTKSLKEAQTATGDYIIVVVARRYVDTRLASGEVTIPGGRVVTRYVTPFDTSISILRELTRQSLEDQILAGDLGPLVFEGEDITDDDDGNFVSEDRWTY